MRGTQGHIAPEYWKTGRSSEKTDVFGYGIMLLELVTGRRAMFFEEDDDIFLLDHVRHSIAFTYLTIYLLTKISNISLLLVHYLFDVYQNKT